ncbi:hypothetical protein RHOSPDRAFT_36953 [Rhodotorula sp. JG-1b]|nr:hypothetical protein RHOSPDRAFT_36953 [Rhodotorula sp. JG-1b]
MQCAACARSETQRNGAWYCQSCISSRLKEYNVKRQQLRNSLTLVTANATALLSASSKSRLGVEHERLLKADKWTLASRAYAAREQVTRTKAQNQAETEQLQLRRQRLAARRANLATAQSLLANLETDLPSASSLSLPLSIPALRARCASLQLALDTLALETARTRAILARELVAAYALRRIIVEQPLPDPFLTAPLAESTLAAAEASSSSSPFFDPSSTLAATLRTRPAPAPIAPTYLVASLPLPKLSQLLSSSSSSPAAPAAHHTHTEALLSHLVHLIRLLALYEGVSLPFNPLPSCFGPGRAGVRVAVGCGDPRSGGGANGGSGDRNTPTPTRTRPSDPPATPPTLTISDGDCFPLCYSSTARSKRRLRPHSNRATSNRKADEEARQGESTATDEGSDSGAVNDGGRATTTTTVFGGGGGGGGARRRNVDPTSVAAGSSSSSRSRSSSSSSSSSKRAKGVLLGAVALAYDLAYLAWRREQKRAEDGSAATSSSSSHSQSHSQRGDWNAPEVLDDLGELLMRAAGVALESSASSARQPDPRRVYAPRPKTNAELEQATLSRTSPAFPLSYPIAAAYFLERVFPQQQQRRSPATAPSASDSLGESGVVVGLVEEDQEEEEDDDDDEWDLVSV